jgi:hypothetical protein
MRVKLNVDLTYVIWFKKFPKHDFVGNMLQSYVWLLVTLNTSNHCTKFGNVSFAAVILEIIRLLYPYAVSFVAKQSVRRIEVFLAHLRPT